jgi:exonuclease SbcC
MSMVENLKKYRLTKYLYNKKSKNNIYTDTKKRKFNLPKSNSFSIKTEANKNNNKLIPVLSLKTTGPVSKNEIEEKLKNKYTQLQLNLSKIKKDLILAKSAEHKKIFELKKKEKLLNKAVNIKKLTLQSVPDNDLVSNRIDMFQKERENELIENSFKSNLLYKIKKEYCNLEKEHQKKLNQISKLKNNIKNCKNKELTKQNQKLYDDFKELKKNYDISMNKNNEYKIKMKEYIELEDKLARKKFFILELQESLKDITNININIENEIEELKIKLKLLEMENNNLNNQFNILNDNCNQVIINKKEIENKYAILVEDENI